jgi:hypothetical protein
MPKLLATALILLSAFFLGTTQISSAIPVTAPSFSLPEKAVEVSSGVYYLGKAIHEGKKVDGYAFVDYHRGHAKPEGVGKGPKTQQCYGYLAKGAKWKTVESWLVNSANSRGLDTGDVFNTLSLAVDTWEDAAGQTILGSGVSTSSTLEADTNSPDDLNEVYFADIDSPGAIGVTIVWGIFGGPPQSRELVEWDQVYDDADYDWSADCLNDNCASKMDFPNIAIHELGHSVGLDDLYDSGCSEATMYGYADYGETNKRTLEAGDIAGVSNLY